MLYVITSLIIVGLSLWALHALAHASAQTYKRVVLWGGVCLLIVVMLLLMRVGQPYIAAVIGVLGIIWRYGRVILRLIGVAQLARRLFGRRKAQKHHAQAPSPQTMSVEEACEVLGVGQEASAQEIKASYQRLMKQVHPDKGGNAYLATKLNTAKSVLLAHKKRT